MFYILWVSRGTLRNIPCSAVFYGETAGASGLSSHEDEQYVDIAWRNARNAACLSQRFRVDAFELLAPLGRDFLNLRVLESTLNLDVLQAVHLVGDESLTVDVTLVLHLDLRSLCNLFLAVDWRFHRSLQVEDDFREVLKVQMWTGHQVDELAAGTQRSGAECFELRIDLFLLDRIVGAEVDDSLDGFLLLQPPVVTVALGNAQLVCLLGESGISIVLSQQDAILGS